MTNFDDNIPRRQLEELRQHTALLRLAILGAVSLSLAAVWLATPRAGAYSVPIKQHDQWIVTCTADNGAPALLVDEKDVAANRSPLGVVTIKVLNTSSTCVHVGADGTGSPGAVTATNASMLIGTGASCVDGPSVVIDGSIVNLGCAAASGGGATDVRVGVWKM